MAAHEVTKLSDTGAHGRDIVAHDVAREDRIARWVLAAASVVMGGLLLWLGRGRTFFFDEWDWVLNRSHGGLHTLLERHNDHISVVPAALYRVVFELVGFEPTVPRVLVVLVHIACVWAVFGLARPRVGPVWGLGAALLVLVLGKAWQDLLWGFQLGFLGSVLGGLLCLLCLDREGPRWRILACVALCAATLSSSLGVPIALGVAVELVWRRRADLWIPGIALALYVVWYLGYGDSEATSEGIVHAPAWAMDAFGAAAGSLMGRGLDWGQPLALLGLGVLAVALWRRAPTPRFAALLVIGAAFWLLTGTARSAGATPESPETSRYIYLGAVVLVLAAVEVAPRWTGRTTTPWLGWAAVAAVALISAGQGLPALRDAAAGLRANSDAVEAEVAASVLAARELPPDFQPAPADAPQIRLGPYLEAVDDEGSSPIGDPQDVLTDAFDADRLKADRVFTQADVHVAGAAAASASSCAVQQTGPRPVTGGRLTVRAGSSPLAVNVRRYASAFQDPPLTTVAPGQAATITFDADASSTPWTAYLTADGGFRVC